METPQSKDYYFLPRLLYAIYWIYRCYSFHYETFYRIPYNLYITTHGIDFTLTSYTCTRDDFQQFYSNAAAATAMATATATAITIIACNWCRYRYIQVIRRQSGGSGLNGGCYILCAWKAIRIPDLLIPRLAAIARHSLWLYLSRLYNSRLIPYCDVL